MRTFFLLLFSLILASAVATRAQEQKVSDTLVSLLEADLSFGRAVAERGISESCRQYLADDAIQIAGRFKSIATDGKSSAMTGKHAGKLDWRPDYVEVSRAGDIGYSVGPY